MSMPSTDLHAPFIMGDEEGAESSERENGLVVRVPTHRPPARRSCRAHCQMPPHPRAYLHHTLAPVHQIHPHLKKFHAGT